MHQSLAIRFRSLAVLLVLMVCVAAPTALAWDYTELTVIDPIIVETNPTATIGQGISVRVRTMNDGGTVDNSVNAILFELSTDHDATLPPSEYIVDGEARFDNVVFNAAGSGIELEARSVDDPTAPRGYVWIDCYPFVDHFNVSVPTGGKWVGEDIPISITAVDAEGLTVPNFADDVSLSAEIGNLGTGPTQFISGQDFVKGITLAQVTFLGTDPVTRSNNIRVLGSKIYPGQTEYPSAEASVSPLWPADLADIVLLLPGETLTPGLSPGKVGGPTAQVAGQMFGDITVYAVDQWWNPVLDDDPGLPLPLSFSTTDLHEDVQLPPDAVLDGNVLLDQGATLITATTHAFSVFTTGLLDASSNSYVAVGPEGLDHFEFNYAIWDTLDVQVTTQPFDIQLTARDFYGNLYPFNGQVSLRVRYGADESADYITASTSEFSGGMLSSSVQVTRRFYSCQLVCDSGGSALTASGAFQVNAGPLASFLVTMPGQTYAPGISTPGFSGNLGSPNPASAGETISSQVRPVDAHFNTVGGTYLVGAASADGFFSLPAHPDYNFQVSNATAMDIVFRTLGSRTVTLTSSQSISGTSSPVQISPGAFARLAVVAPGEVLVPGIFDTIEDDGKSGQPEQQDAGIGFSVTVVATDDYWNPVSESDAALPLTLDFSSTDPVADLPEAGQILSTPSGAFSVALKTLADPNFQTVAVEDIESGNSAFTAVPLQAGALDHFTVGVNHNTNPTPNDTLEPLPDLVAGQVLSNLTIVARDQFDNHIPWFDGSATFELSHGSGIFTPDGVDFADGGTWPGEELGVWRGSLSVYRAGSEVVLTVTDDTYARTGVSNAFDVSADEYADLLILLPGETSNPGIAPGKVGSPFDITAGVAATAQVLAVDAWYNLVPNQSIVELETSAYSEFLSQNPTTLQPNGTLAVELFFRTAGMQILMVSDVAYPDRNDESRVDIMPAPFTRLQVVAPGENPNPGGYEADGKTGSPDLQVSSLVFDVHVRAVDDFWNLVENNDENIQLSSSDDSFSDENPPNQGQNLSEGTIDFPIFLTSSGSVQITASPLNNLDILPQSVGINVSQGSHYVMTVPDSAWVGPPETFFMSVSLVDSLGNPEGAAGNMVYLQALKSTLDPASSILWVGEATLNSGVVEIPAQAYDTVEDIIIHVTDDAGRSAYSSPIRMLPNGLDYRVRLPDGDALVVGPPSTFTVEVEVLDVDTETRITVDRSLDIEIWSAVDGAPGQGSVGINSVTLDDGFVSFSQSYTRAENIYIHAEDEFGEGGNSPIFSILPDGYKRLQLILPGEEVRAGIDAFTATGKAGTPDTQRSRTPFALTVRAVDQFWNLHDSEMGGAVYFNATDNSIGAGNPAEGEGLPFVNGRRNFTLYLESEGVVDLGALDGDDPAIPGQTVSVPIQPGFYFTVDVADTEPSTGYPGFQMTVQMIDPVTGEAAPEANHSFSIEALNPDMTPAGGNLNVISGTLASGSLVINDQQYDIAEQIVLRVSDDYGRSALGPLLSVQPGGLTYEVMLPDSATAGGPSSFDMAIHLIDTATGNLVAHADTVISLEIFSAQTGLEGQGTLAITSAVTDGGIAQISQTYTAAGAAYFTVSDARGVTGISPTLYMRPDGYKRLQIIAPGEVPEPGRASSDGKSGIALPQQAEIPFSVEVRATDQYWNPVDTFTGGSIHLGSSDGSIQYGNPVNQGAPLLGGQEHFEIIIHNQGMVEVTVEDSENPEAAPHGVDLAVEQAHFEIIVPPLAQAGPPSTFPMTVRLVDTAGELIEVANHEVFLEALKPNEEQALDTLAVVSGMLSGGELQIPDQAYATVEDIVIRVTDFLGREDISGIIEMVPEGVTYFFDTPTQVTAGPPTTFEMSVRLVDTSTGQVVTTDDRSFTLEALNHHTGEDGRGVLALGSGTLGEGVNTLAQSYSAAETIYFRLSDDRGLVCYSDPIQVQAANAQSLTLDCGTTILEVGQSTWLQAGLTDLYGNDVSGDWVHFQILYGDGSLTTDSVISGATGIAANSLDVPEGGREDILVRVHSGNLSPVELAVEVIGPPLTVLDLGSQAVETGGTILLTPSTEISLSSSSEIGLFRIYYGMDLGEEAVPDQIYDGPLSFDDLGISSVGTHRLTFCAEDIHGHLETPQTVLLALGSRLTRPISNRPNPFMAGREETLIMFHAAADGMASVKIHDLFGNPVWSIEIQTDEGEVKQVAWDGRNGNGDTVGNGGYLAIVRTGDQTLKRKIAVVK